jgi:hypothetical protein
MFPLATDAVLIVSVVRVQIGGLWYTLEIAVTPEGVLYAIVQVGESSLWE